MGAASTVYDVKVVYKVDDRSSKPLSGIGDAASKADKWLGRLAIGAATGFGLRTAYGFLIKYNQGLEQAQNQLSTIIMGNQGGTWERSTKMASVLMLQFRDDAKQTAGTMKDLVDFGSMIINPILQAGGGMKEVRDFTKGAVVAASALGQRADVAARDISQALTVGVQDRDVFAKALLGFVHVSKESFNALSLDKRLGVLRKALQDPAIVAAAKKYETSFAGVTSSLKDNVDIIAGRIGLPLFQAVTKEIRQWTVWIDQHPRKIDEFVANFRNGLMEGFQLVKKIVSFIVEHRDLLMTIAKAYLVGKGASFVGTGLKGIGGAINAISNMGSATEKTTGALGRFGGGMLSLLPVIASIAQFAADWVLDAQEERIQRKVDTQSVRLSSTAYGKNLAGTSSKDERWNRNQLIQAALDAGVIDKAGKINEAKLYQNAATNLGYADAQDAQRRSDGFDFEFEAAKLRIMLVQAHRDGADYFAKRMTAAQDAAAVALLERFKGILPWMGEGTNPMKAPPTTPKIDRLVIQVSSDDPDRFVMGIEGYLNEWVKNGVPPTGLNQR